MTINFIKKTYYDVLVKPRLDVNFWILSSFLPTFLLSRMLVYALPTLFVNVKGVHIHHFTYGIILLALAGFLAQNLDKGVWKIRIAAVYGVGLALSFDEFGMWLRLQDAYWVRQSYDAILVIFSLLINIVYFSTFWLKLLSFPQKIKRKARGG